MPLLNRDVELKFRDFHNVVARKGTRVDPIKCGDGVHYAVHPNLVEVAGDRGPRSIWVFDTDHYHIWVPDDAVGV
jgi:hypothetical protein